MNGKYEAPDSEAVNREDVPLESGAGLEAETGESLCDGFWRLRESVVLRLEETGALLFDPDLDATIGVNRTGAALLQWRPERVNFEQWCEALTSHYGDVEPERVESDVKRFLTVLRPFLEKLDV